MGVEPKIGGKPPKIDGENNRKPLLEMDDLGVPLFLETPISEITTAKKEPQKLVFQTLD